MVGETQTEAKGRERASDLAENKSTQETPIELHGAIIPWEKSVQN